MANEYQLSDWAIILIENNIAEKIPKNKYENRKIPGNVYAFQNSHLPGGTIQNQLAPC